MLFILCFQFHFLFWSTLQLHISGSLYSRHTSGKWNAGMHRSIDIRHIAQCMVHRLCCYESTESLFIEQIKRNFRCDALLEFCCWILCHSFSIVPMANIWHDHWRSHLFEFKIKCLCLCLWLNAQCSRQCLGFW